MFEIALIYLAVYLVLAGALLLAAAALFLRLARWLLRSASSDLKTTLPIAAALSLCLFGSVAGYVARGAGGALNGLFFHLPRELAPLAANDVPSIADGLAQVAGRLSPVLNVGRFIANFPVVPFILMLLFALLLAAFMSALLQVSRPAETAGAGQEESRRSRERALVYLYVLLAAVSLYGGVASIASVSLLSRASDPAVASDELADEIEKQRTAYHRATAPPERDERTTAALAAIGASNLPGLEGLGADPLNRVKGLNVRYTDLLDQEAAKAIRSYDAEKGAKSAVIVRRHKEALLRRYADLVSMANAQLERCEEAVVDQLAMLRDRVAPVCLAAAEGPSTDACQQSLNDARYADRWTRSLCEFRPVHFPEPERELLSRELGFLGAWSNWLVDTESMEVALIVGLVAFGVLGSLIASSNRVFVTAFQSPAPVGLEPVRELGASLLRGVGAAITLFLAVFGGLAVVDDSQVSPNPYVMLLFCFLAGAFSARVWTTAQEWLNQPLSRKQDEPRD